MYIQNFLQRATITYCQKFTTTKIPNPKLCEETGKRQKLPLLQPFKLKDHFQAIVITGFADTSRQFKIWFIRNNKY